MLNYPAAWPTVWRNLTHGYEVGQQSDLLFTVKYENLLSLPPSEARNAIGMRGFKGPSSSREASRIFGEGREII
jgi:ubiquinone biosynthesis protein Coq4